MRLILILVLSTSVAAWGQSSNKQASSLQDSIAVKKIVETFYQWYAELIKDEKIGTEFNPRFVKAKNGMTSLDFSKYIDGLRNNHFTEGYIKRKIKDYDPCINNLAKIKYETLLGFEDLDQFEEIKCDFSNVYEWIADMEPHDGAELTRVISTEKGLIGTIQFYNINTDGKKSIWDHKNATIIFRLESNEWRIDNIKMEQL